MTDKYGSSSLEEIFKNIEQEKLIIPNFQRKFVWERDKQKKLLASFLVEIPIGSLLLLSGEQDNFASKKLCYQKSGNLSPSDRPCEFLLDGQQRLSCLWSMFYDFRTNNVLLKDIYPKLRTLWYLKVKPVDETNDHWGWNNLHFTHKTIKDLEPDDILQCLEYRLCSKSTKIKSADDLAQLGLIPLWGLFGKETDPLYIDVINIISKNRMANIQNQLKGDESEKREIIQLLKHVERNIEKYIDNEDAKDIDFAWMQLATRWERDIKDFVEGVLKQELSTINLPKKEVTRATAIFENLNRGGTRLSTFDLIVAKVYSKESEKSLRESIVDLLTKKEYPYKYDLCVREKDHTSWTAHRIKAIHEKEETLEGVIVKQFLNILSLICYSKQKDGNRFIGVNGLKIDSIKKRQILDLSAEEIRQNYKQAVNCLKRTLMFLQYRCGITAVSKISYDLMLLPIAYTLQENRHLKDKSILDKLEYWYWLSIFSGRYREKQNERCIEDVKDMYHWAIKKENNVFEQKLSLESERFKNLLNVQGYLTEELLLQEKEDRVKKTIGSALLQYVLSKKPYDLQLDPEKKVVLRAWDLAPTQIERHHIIPLNEGTKIGESTKKIRQQKDHILNSPLNLCYITQTANRAISDYSPNEYLRFIIDNYNSLPLHNHCIPNDKELFEKIKKDPSTENIKEFCRRRFQEIEKDIKEKLKGLVS